MFPSTIHFLFCSLITYQRPCLFHVPLFEVVSCYLWYQLATRQRYMYQALTRKVKKKFLFLLPLTLLKMTARCISCELTGI